MGTIQVASVLVILLFFGYGCQFENESPNTMEDGRLSVGENEMNQEKFWEIIDSVHQSSNGDMDVKCAEITKIISSLPEEEAKQFYILFYEQMNRLYSWPLWGAAYVIGGGCSDDAFSDFRSSLISRGRQAVEKAVADPDSLSEIDLEEDDWFYEGYNYAVMDGVEASAESLPDRPAPPSEPSGTVWSEKEVSSLYPKLSNKLGY